MSIRDHLTKPNPEQHKLEAATPPGCAHWAGTGPFGATCKDCEHYGFYRETKTKNVFCNGCERYYAQIGKAITVSPSTPACKYFVRSATNAPSAT